MNEVNVGSKDIDTMSAEKLGMIALPTGLHLRQFSDTCLAPTLPHPAIGINAAAILNAEHLGD